VTLSGRCTRLPPGCGLCPDWRKHDESFHASNLRKMAVGPLLENPDVFQPLAARRGFTIIGEGRVLMLTNEQIAEAAKKYSLEGFLKRHSSPVRTISLSEVKIECHAFEAWEPRDSMYRVSTFLVREWWGDPAKLVDALSVLLLIWNGAFYRYGTFDEATAETCMRANQTVLDGFRERAIASFSEADEKEMGRLFNLVSKALGRKVDGVESPVSAGKALHLLAPNFFPLWDQYIAPAYDCPYTGELASVAYIVFTRKMRAIAVQLTTDLATAAEPEKEWLSRKPLLKRIDEYNYMKYTIPGLKKTKAKAK